MQYTQDEASSVTQTYNRVAYARGLVLRAGDKIIDTKHISANNVLTSDDLAVIEEGLNEAVDTLQAAREELGRIRAALVQRGV